MNILKSTWTSVCQQKLLSIVSITGTALAIFLIMVVVMLQQVKVAPFAPESNRDRFLHINALSGEIDDAGNHFESNGGMSYEHAKTVLLDMKTPEAVAIYSWGVIPGNISIPAQTPVNVDYKAVNDSFWKVFDFTFIDGKPFETASYEAGIPIAVISESVARKLFGETAVTGRRVNFNHVDYAVGGVVKDVSTLASNAYAQVWIPITASVEATNSWNNNIFGSLYATILAKSSDDFDEIRDEYNKKINDYNTVIKNSTGWSIFTRNRPYTQEKLTSGSSASVEPDEKAARKTRVIIYAILLLVPAINLSSMTESRLRHRVSEIGVRRAFGAKRRTIMSGLIAENLLITVVAGAIGWILSIAFAYIYSNFLFSQPFSMTLNPPEVNISMLIQPSTFFWALLFCFILNFISTCIPAMRASRSNIVNALGGKH